MLDSALRVASSAASGTRLIDLLETEIASLPSPCTRAHVEQVLDTLAQAQAGGVLKPDVQEVLTLLALQRKLPVSGGKRGSKTVPVVASGLWYQVLQQTEDRYLAFTKFTPLLMTLLGAACGRRGTASGPQASQYIAGSANETPTVVPRNPVELWLESTAASGSEAQEGLPEWCSRVSVHTETAQQCVDLLKQLVGGVEVEMNGQLLMLTALEVSNCFASDSAHPAHLRKAAVHMLITAEKKKPMVSMPVLVEVEHVEIATLYETSAYKEHYHFFWSRTLNLSQAAFDTKFENLLLFLVEAIGVPVLLSLLLLTYSSTNTSQSVAIDLDELPDNRHQLYKMGIMSGIQKRILLESRLLQHGEAADAVKASQEDASAGARTRVKRKTTLEQNLGTALNAGSGAVDDELKARLATHQMEPVLDLNSILRGKKVRLVTGENEVAECYSLVVRGLDKSKQPGFDLRTGIVAVVPKSHTMHGPVTALVEYVLQPPTRTEEAIMDVCKKMLRRVAVDNQEHGRREFTSKDVACCLGEHPDELGLWARLDFNHDHGVALAATLAKQTDKAPAQYQFKHLSFQEGLYAEYLLMLVTSLVPPQGAGWPGWHDDHTAAEFLNK